MVELRRWICGEAAEVMASGQFADPYRETSCVAHIRFERTIGILVANRTCGQWMARFATYGSGRRVVAEAPERVTVVENRQSYETALTPLDSGWATVQDRLEFR